MTRDELPNAIARALIAHRHGRVCRDCSEYDGEADVLLPLIDEYVQSEHERTAQAVEALATTREVAEFLRLDPQTVKSWRQRGKGPRWLSFEGSVRYRWVDVEEWTEQSERQNPHPTSSEVKI